VFGFSVSLALTNGKCAGRCVLKSEIDPNVTRTCFSYMFADEFERRCIDNEYLQENNTRAALRLALESTTPCTGASCYTAMTAFFCAQDYPKCDADGYILAPCRSTCLNARSICSCGVDLEKDCLEYEGTGPSPTCTGAGFSLKASFAVLASVFLLLL